MSSLNTRAENDLDAFVLGGRPSESDPAAIVSPCATKWTHRFKYRLALVVAGECVLRYDNENGKGDHRHAGDVEMVYTFNGYEKLLADSWADVEAWRKQR